jgi:hypothetical protein
MKYTYLFFFFFFFFLIFDRMKWNIYITRFPSYPPSSALSKIRVQLMDMHVSWMWHDKWVSALPYHRSNIDCERKKKKKKVIWGCLCAWLMLIQSSYAPSFLMVLLSHERHTSCFLLFCGLEIHAFLFGLQTVI